MELRLPLEVFPGRQATCRAVFGTWGSFPDDARASHCPFVLTSFTGWSSKRCPGIGFLSRGDREIGVLRNVEPPTRPRLECRRETGLILRCDRKVGNPFQTKQGSRPSCPDQEGRRGSEEVVRENLGVPLEGDRDVGALCGSHQGCQVPFRPPKDGRRVGLVGACVSDYPWIGELMRILEEHGVEVSISSLRADSLTEDLVASLQRGGHRTLTMAPEAGTERLRAPGPDGHPFGKLTLSVSSFVPKPWTPFQWAPFDDTRSLEDKLDIIKRGARRLSVRVVHENPREAGLQALLARGDRRVADLVEI